MRMTGQMLVSSCLRSRRFSASSSSILLLMSSSCRSLGRGTNAGRGVRNARGRLLLCRGRWTEGGAVDFILLLSSCRALALSSPSSSLILPLAAQEASSSSWMRLRRASTSRSLATASCLSATISVFLARTTLVSPSVLLPSRLPSGVPAPVPPIAPWRRSCSSRLTLPWSSMRALWSCAFSCLQSCSVWTAILAFSRSGGQSSSSALCCALREANCSRQSPQQLHSCILLIPTHPPDRQTEVDGFGSYIIMEGREAAGEERHPLEEVIGSRAKFITTDGRVFVGVLKGLDQSLNCVISEAEERVYSQEAGVATHRLGTYFIRGDSIMAMGAFAETEEEMDALQEVTAKPIAYEA